MYCRKCGKEIKDNSKFCPYCGNEMSVAQSSPSVTDRPELNSDIGTYTTDEQEDPPTSEKKAASRPKWVVPVAVVSSVAVIGVVAYMGVRVMQEPEVKFEKMATDTQKLRSALVDITGLAESAESAVPEQPIYPVEITLSADEMQGVTDLLYILSKVDANEEDGCFSKSTVIDDSVVSSFLISSADFQVPFVNGQTVQMDSRGCIVPEEILDQYIKNSLGCEEYSLDENFATYVDGNVIFQPASGGAEYGTTTPQITKVEQISADEIEVWGTDEYLKEKMSEPYTAEFDVIMRKNPDSMWGGYTLTEIKSWGRQESDTTTGTTGDWKQAFINAINPRDAYNKTVGQYSENGEEESYDTYAAFNLWDMNKDGIPEIICTYGGWNSAGSGILYAYNPQTDSITENVLGGRAFTYSGEELCATGGIGGGGHSTVYTLNNDGNLKEEFMYGWVCNSTDNVTTYYRNETEISEAEYKQYSNTYTQNFENYLTYGALIQEIQNYAQ